jgi:hypothetical protein
MPAAGARGRRRPAAGRAVGEGAVTVLVLAALGALGGVVWALVATPAEFTRLANGGAMNEAALGRQFSADGWYVVISLVAGVLAGAVLTWWRSRDALRTCGALLLGAAVAAAVMAVVGHLLGPGDPRPALQAAHVGAHVPERLDVGEGSSASVWGYLADRIVIYLCWPLGVLAGSLLVLLTRRGDSSSSQAPG